MNIIDKLLGRKTVADPVVAAASPASRPQRPEWATNDLRLPPWAKISDTQFERACVHIEVDSEAAYAYWLALLGFSELTQYNLECAAQCIKLDLQAATALTEHDMRFAGRHVAVTMSRAEKYAQAQYPKGKSSVVKDRTGKEVTLSGADLASKGLEARGHYMRIRGALPM